MNLSKVFRRTLATATLLLFASEGMVWPVNAAALQSEGGLSRLMNTSHAKASAVSEEANKKAAEEKAAAEKASAVSRPTAGQLSAPAVNSGVQRASEIRQAAALRGKLRSARGIESSTLQRLDAALAVIATPTATTDELGKAEAELDAFLATQSAASPSQANLNQEQQKASSMQKKLDGVSESVIRNFAG